MHDLPRAIFFDLDDTIIDDSANVHDAWLTVVESRSSALPGLAPADVVALVHEVREWFWSDPERHRTGRADLRAASTWIIGEALSRFGIKDAALARGIAESYRDLRESARNLFPGAIEALERTRSLGIRAALLTNGDSVGQRAKLVQFDLARYFDYISIEGEFGCGKPDERVYKGALAALGCPPERTWMIGDNLEWDVAAPMRLGITGIWHDRFRTGLPEGAAVVPDRTVLGVHEIFEDGRPATQRRPAGNTPTYGTSLTMEPSRPAAYSSPSVPSAIVVTSSPVAPITSCSVSTPSRARRAKMAPLQKSENT
jgi:putative hydrolase of the HAD superfamily